MDAGDGDICGRLSVAEVSLHHNGQFKPSFFTERNSSQSVFSVFLLHREAR